MARPKKPTDTLKDQRVPIMMSEEELKTLDDWMFENRIRSRGEAIRRLLQMGILAHQNRQLLRVGLHTLADRIVHLSKVIRDANPKPKTGIEAARHETVEAISEIFEDLANLGMSVDALAEGEDLVASMQILRDIVAEAKD
ncbi:hypothetical protein [Rhizobium sp.]|uniref:hypothetical protein n=1 Tax=Rhizobium sp. TaxID=391 RepID=UPI0028A8AFAE